MKFASITSTMRTVTVIVLIQIAYTVHATVMNGGFEAGDFSDWMTVGDASIETAAFGAGPTEGSFQALITTGAGSALQDDLENFLGLASGTLDGLGNGNAREGSAIKQTFTANAGDLLSFDVNFLTNESTPDPFINDFAIFTAFVSITEIADLNSAFIISPTIFDEETDFLSFNLVVPNSGSHTLGLGVIDEDDQAGVSALLIDNVTVTTNISPVPEPSTHALLAIGLGVLAFCRSLLNDNKKKALAPQIISGIR